jgi:predicted DNA-binding transcriptional regulator AlpA
MMLHDLLTIAEIAMLFRRSRRTVAEDWIKRPDFPRPVFAPTPKSRFWSRADVERWAAPKQGQR